MVPCEHLLGEAMNRTRVGPTFGIIASAMMLCATSNEAGAALVFSGTSGGRVAEAEFDLTGNLLTVTLRNTSSADVLVPSDVLMAVFFDTSSTLTAVSASLNGSSVYYGSLINNVGEGWQYGHPVNAQGKNSGISATGLGIFGNANWFYTSPKTPLNGLDYGILSAGDDTATANSGISGHGPLIKNQIQFTLLTAPGFSLSELGNSVVFQYGTSTAEPHFQGTVVPESATIFAGALVLLPMAASTIQIVRRKHSA